MNDMTARVLAMMADGILDRKSAAQLLDILWPVDGRFFRVQQYL